jgi:hypothetical protein
VLNLCTSAVYGPCLTDGKPRMDGKHLMGQSLYDCLYEGLSKFLTKFACNMIRTMLNAFNSLFAFVNSPRVLPHSGHFNPARFVCDGDDIRTKVGVVWQYSSCNGPFDVATKCAECDLSLQPLSLFNRNSNWGYATPVLFGGVSLCSFVSL